MSATLNITPEPITLLSMTRPILGRHSGTLASLIFSDSTEGTSLTLSTSADHPILYGRMNLTEHSSAKVASPTNKLFTQPKTQHTPQKSEPRFRLLR